MAPPTYETLQHSSYIDFTGYRVTDQTTVASAYGITQSAPFAPSSDTPGIAVALVLERANDPTTLLSGNWAERQQAIAALNSNGNSIWSTYGSNPAVYQSTKSYITDTLGLTVLDSSNSNYVSSAESRTIWVAIDTATAFQTLFNTELSYTAQDGGLYFWNDELQLPSEINLAGLWMDFQAIPNNSNLAHAPAVHLTDGPQSIGNGAPFNANSVNLVPQDMAAQYNFPLNGAALQTKPIGLIEPAIGAALPNGGDLSTFQQLLTDYLTAIGTSGTGVVSVQGESGQNYTDYGGRAGERSLDLSVVAGVNPNSNVVLFNGAGGNGLAQGSTYTTIQSATFPGAGQQRVSVWSDSFGDIQSMKPDSPYYKAYWELYVDTVLANQTAVTALGDGGSSEEIGNGLTNLEYNCTQPYSLLVGGTSLSLLSAAEKDPTLATVLSTAMAGDLGLIWQLVSGGMSKLPTSLGSSDFFLEAAWNYYTVVREDGATYIHGPLLQSGDWRVTAGYTINSATNGGVDPTQPTPNYQVAYGLSPVTTDPAHETGRGAPDVTANAGGNAWYKLANGDMSYTGGFYYGTSAASPLWAALIAQIDTVFDDQGLPDLGYAHDLLYTASAIAPASFNDVTMGNNVGSFIYGGTERSVTGYASDGTPYYWDVTATGFGYYAGPGYDLVSGLGSPNGTVLARTLSAIAHSQMYFSSSPDMLDGNQAGGWTSGVHQSLLFQTMSANGAAVDIGLGSHDLHYFSGGSATFAWTAQFAGQSLQADFDSNLVRLFDKYGQGMVVESLAQSGDSLSVSVNGAAGAAIQATLSNPFGFADFMTETGVVRVARPVAVAETAGAADDQMAIVRVRQNGQDPLGVAFYKVDDLAGTINGIAPGHAGYSAAAQGNAYQLATGGTLLGGPGYGNYGQNALLHVDAGDLVAMALVNFSHGDTYYAFSQANPDGKGHLWNYGLNTWGWEDTKGGGDHDFNDLVVQLDFTSASGHGWLV